MINREKIQQARRADLVAYLIAKGEDLKRVGKNFTIEKHDSLYIKSNMFVWYSRNQKGNPIDFLMCYYNMPFQQAVEELTSTMLNDVQIPSYEPSEPSVRADNEKRILGYLCKKRCLESRIIFSLIKQEKLYQDTNGNCNFVITDWDEQPIGEEIVGTGDTRFKLISTHSGYGFHTIYGDPSDILYFESAIDLLSCYQIYQDKFTHHLFVSMGGLNSSVVHELHRLKPNLKHWLCVDNDTAGINFIAQMKQEIRELHTFQPPKTYKDWNEYLCGTGKKTNITSREKG